MKLSEKKALEIAKKAGVDPGDLIGIYKKPKSTIAFWFFVLLVMAYLIKEGFRMAFAKGLIDKIVLIPSAIVLSLGFFYLIVVIIDCYYMRIILDKKKIMGFQEIKLFSKIIFTHSSQWEWGIVRSVKLQGYSFNKKKISSHILRDNIVVLEIKPGFESKRVKDAQEKIKNSVFSKSIAYLGWFMFNQDIRKEKLPIPYENNSDLGDQIIKLVPSDCEIIIDK